MKVSFVFQITLVFSFLLAEALSVKLCELKRTCFLCDPRAGQYSFFTCQRDSDCFPEEFCTAKGFCCRVLTGDGVDDLLPTTTTTTKVTTNHPKTTVKAEKCPDNSTFGGRKCLFESDCIFREEICVFGRCCPSCRNRRMEALGMKQSGMMENLQKNELSNTGNNTYSFAHFVPQCTEDGRFYKPLQCLAAECFCVTKYGERIGTEQSDANRTVEKLSCVRGDDQHIGNGIDSNRKQKQFDKDEAKPHPKTIATALPLVAIELFKGENHLFKESPNSNCLDPLREFRRCGSACPVSCASIQTKGNNNYGPYSSSSSRCPKECIKGCFCRLPYIVQDSNRPFSSKCVLPAECPNKNLPPPLLAGNEDFPAYLNPWESFLLASPFDSGFYVPMSLSAETSPQTMLISSPSSSGVGEMFSEQNQQDFTANESPQQQQLESYTAYLTPPEKCFDPLKNFLTCGSLCPVACGGRNDFLSCPTTCVPGCFCRVPYVLRDPHNPNSECVMPYQCPPPKIDYAFVRPANDGCGANKVWSKCLSRKCVRSCDNQPAFCFPSDCATGCECLPGFVVLDRFVPQNQWICVLPEQCPSAGSNNNKILGEFYAPVPKWFNRAQGSETPKSIGGLFTPLDSSTTSTISAEKRKDEGFVSSSSTITSKTTTTTTTTMTTTTPNWCSDPKKEYLSCVSSCPMGCDQLEPKQCSPCVSGCFCKNGFVFANSSDWERSECIPISQCHEKSVSGTASTEILIEEGDEDGERSLQKPFGGSPQSNIRIVEEDQHHSSIPETERNCDDEEMMASEAVIFAGASNRLGRILAWPVKKGRGEEERELRLVGYLNVKLPTSDTIREVSLYLSVHRFGDTTERGCRNVGPRLPVRYFRQNQTFPNDSGEFGDRSSHLGEIKIASTTDTLGPIRLDLLMQWTPESEEARYNNGTKAGKNPIEGHSVVLASRTSGKLWDVEGLLACATFSSISSSC